MEGAAPPACSSLFKPSPHVPIAHAPLLPLLPSAPFLVTHRSALRALAGFGLEGTGPASPSFATRRASFLTRVLGNRGELLWRTFLPPSAFPQLGGPLFPGTERELSLLEKAKMPAGHHCQELPGWANEFVVVGLSIY